MHIKCRCNQRSDITLECNCENAKFYVSSSFENIKSDDSAKLIGYFGSDEKEVEFEFGIYSKNNEIMSLDKSYSLSYLTENKVDPEKLLRFEVLLSDNTMYTLYPLNESVPEEDASLTRAKDVLDKLKSKKEECPSMELLLSSIGNTLGKYKRVTLPFMPEFSWYKINNGSEFFNLSSVKHLKQSDDFTQNQPWYFGRSNDERICAFAAEGKKGSVNPISNADDCTVSYVSSSSDKAYFVVGILLLDDGQYFCRLD